MAHDQTTPDSFTRPRHWVDLEELDPQYWQDPSKQELRGQEFVQKPIESLEKLEKSSKFPLARREFLTLMGSSIAMATLSCARRPVRKIIPYVVRPEEVIPGVPTWYASTCQACSKGCGILAKNREGRPIKLEGNPDHPINQGRLCVKGQGSLLSLYDPDRLQAPVGLQDGKTIEVDWPGADSRIQVLLRQAMEKKSKVRVLTGAIYSPSTQRLIEEFLGAFSDGQHIQYEPLAFEEISTAQEQSYGTAVIPRYDFEKAKVVFSLGADFLGTWVSPLEHAADWVKRRKLNSKKHAHAELSKLITVESDFSITGANSDERVPVPASGEIRVALALAHELIVRRKRSRYSSDPEVVRALQSFGSSQWLQEVSVEAQKITQWAELLWEHRGESLVVAGGLSTKTPQAVALQVVTNLLNSALDNEGQTVDGVGDPARKEPSPSALFKLVQEMNAGQVDVLFIYHCNPSYHLPASVGFNEALKKVKTVVVHGERLDETARLAHFALPSPHYLENWGDHQSRNSHISLQQPTIGPLFSVKSFEDCMLGWIRGARLPVSGLAKEMMDPNQKREWYDYLRENWRRTLFPKSGASQFEDFWVESVQKGVWISAKNPSKGSRNFKSSSLSGLASLHKELNQAEPGLKLALYETMALGNGNDANNPWLQEVPNPITTVTWDNYLGVSPTTAKKMNLSTNDVVKLKVGEKELEAPILVQAGLHENSLTLAVGYGRTSCGQVGNQVGVNAFSVTHTSSSGQVFSGQSASIEKTGKRYELALTQGHHRSEGRPILNDISLKSFRENPRSQLHTNPHLRMETVPTIWPTFDYTKGYRWGMAIDLNHCIGCSACVVACQAENNVPVVGRARVRESREMHWIRIDRYYSGSEENPNVIFQPMLCQHCENAPCETVCPVLATVHNAEGLNEMVYNRCVGTRYCQNNCPYKVRRFNYFDHWKDYHEPMNLAWNPDITVRTRGVMEKCTFCIQRINEAKQQAKQKGRHVQDGDFQTACQQTCPTQAISFGNINDSASQVAQQSRDERGFYSLEVLNTKPSITYLTKVRNQDEEETHGHH